MMKKKTNSRHEQQPVTLRTVAEHVGLAPCSVSAILNNSAAGMSIPQQTKDRVWRAARRLNYQPNYSARALRTRRTYTVAILMPDIGYAPAARIAAGAEDFLRENDYCMIIATYDQSSEWQQNQFTQLRQRGVEGVILLQAELALSAGFPVTTVHAVPAQASPMTAAAREKLTIVGRKAATQLVHEIEEAGGRLGGSPYAGVLTGEDTLTLRQAPTERRL